MKMEDNKVFFPIFLTRIKIGFQMKLITFKKLYMDDNKTYKSYSLHYYRQLSAEAKMKN